MKTSFTITSITVAGHPDRPDSTVTFKRGLNVICGPSNTGKSWVLHCIDYMFGAKAERFSLHDYDGYTHVIMSVCTDAGPLTLRRTIGEGSNDVIVDSANPRVPSGTYKCANASMNNPSLSHMWLRLIGFDGPEGVRIIKNQDYRGGLFTWRTFSHILYSNESSVSKPESILLPSQSTGDTAFKSALAVLITGRNFASDSYDEPPKRKQSNNNAVISYLEARPKVIHSRLDLIDRTMNSGSLEPLHDEIDTLGEEITHIQESLRNATSEEQHIAADLNDIRERMAETNMLKRRYEELASSYRAKLDRFDFVVEGRELTGIYPRLLLCPVCNQVLPSDMHDQIVHPNEEERDLLQTKLDDLLTIMKEMEEELQRASECERDLVARSKSIDELVRGRLLPRLDGLKGKLADHNELVAMRGERRYLEQELTEVVAEIERRKAMTFPKGNFDAFKYYPPDFWEVMSSLLLDTLGACAFPNLREASFERKTFDAIVNDMDKSRDGRGYRSFINTVVLLTLHRYLASEHSVYDPGIVMIDTPLLGLDDPQQGAQLQEMQETIPMALYDFLSETDEIGQMIIVDNTKFMPDLTSLEDRCNIIRFTKRDDSGRYGFLLGVHDGDLTGMRKTDEDDAEIDMEDGR